MEFRILGPLEARGELGPLPLGRSKPRAVLAILLLHPNEPVSVERLALALWGEDAPAGATKTVQVHVSRLRKALGDPEAVTTTAAGYRLRVRADELDLDRFTRGVAAGRAALGSGEPERAAALLREALGLWRGPPLEELAWAPFAPAESDRLEELRLAAVELRVEADLAAARHHELVAELRQLATEHPWRERLHAQLMLALYRSGRQAEALDAYRRARAVLVEELGIEPGSELHDLHQAMLVHDPAIEPPGSAATRESALPSPPNRTIGRDGDVRAVVERLRSGAVRLLTLTGPGGVGKTRLAVEAARAVEADFADGARFVSLAAVERAQDVAPALVGALGVVALAGESAGQAVERFLRAKHLLLVVDNCEHLPAAAPFLGGLPAGCPAVTVLATSREPLAVHAEQLHPVSPLALPPRGVPADAVVEVDAVALFCERARAHDPGFEPTDAAAVAEICRRVDGLPLAIELAAARCGLLSPSEIAERLDHALGALGSGPRDAPARHHTLRATIDWSHNLLDVDEQTCFARFAVFAGGATVEAAEAITGAGVDTLDRLVAKCLLVRRRQGNGPTRLRMLATVREYAGEQFAAVADREAVRERHYHFFLALARSHGTDQALLGPNRVEHLRRLDSEQENLYAALGWSLEQDTGGPALELFVTLNEYWMARNRYADAVRFIDRALSKPGADRVPELRVHALCRKGWALWPLGRRAEQAGVMAEAEATARALADPAVLSTVLLQRAVLESFTDRLDVASAFADEAVSCAEAAGDPWTLAAAAWARAVTSGSATQLRERVDQAAPLLRTAGNVYHLAALYEMAAYRALCSGSDRDAKDYASRAVPLVRDLNHRPLWLHLLRKVGPAALFTGDTEAARDAFREQLELCRELVILPAATGLSGLAAVAVIRDDLDRAARLCGAAAAHRHGDPEDAIDARLHATFSVPARSRLGPDAWDAAFREGAALSFDDAIAYALTDGSTAQPRVPAGHAR